MITNKPDFDGAILDMDGVITKTAILHAKAWKQMFDDFLKKRQGTAYRPLDVKEDYHRYIDGIPRYDGIRKFLQSRNISIPEGRYDDQPSIDSVYGLGNRKNEAFLSILKKEGIEVYPDALEVIRLWKKNGIKLAVISSSRNCRHIMEVAGLLQFFEARVDGDTLITENLPGKPEPEMFLRACELLGTLPGRTIVIEDAILGIHAGVKGGFGLVVGVARDKPEEVLSEAGADIVVKKLTDLVTASGRLSVAIKSKNNYS